MAREWQVDAEGVLGAVYGATYAAAILKSGHHTLLSNKYVSPKFPVRGVWISSSTPLSNSSAISRRLLETGHNTVVADSCSLNEADIQELQNHKIQVTLTLANTDAPFCPLDKAWSESIKKLFDTKSSAQAILWTSGLLNSHFFRDPAARDATLADLVRAEMRFLEKIIEKNKKLIFYIPTKDHTDATQQMHWLPALIDDAGPRTTIAFSAVAGEPTHDHLPLHPLWNFFRTDPIPSRTPLLPIINAGAVAQGGGLWPYVNIDMLQHIHSRLNPLHFQGALHLAPAFPVQGSFLDAGLWTAGASLWLGIDPVRCFETWTEAFRPVLNTPAVSAAMEEGRQITLAMSRLRFSTQKPEEYRACAESLWARLEVLQISIKDPQFPTEEGRAALSHYFLSFIRDMRKMIAHTLQMAQQPFSKMISQEEMQESFWASAQAESAQGIRPSGQLSLPTIPCRGKEGSVLHHMFTESWIENGLRG